MLHRDKLQQLQKKIPQLHDIRQYKETFWLNEKYAGNSQQRLASVELSAEDIRGAEARLKRFQPFIAETFPETRKFSGIIESPLVEIKQMKGWLNQTMHPRVEGRLLLKCDNLLPISGSVKARGGIYEVLAFAEKIALSEKLITQCDNYIKLRETHCKKIFSRYRLAVGSTGNLGLSIGIMGAAFGIEVTVHMSADAKQWKKELLRKHGVQVIEHLSDYSEAVEAGRNQSMADPLCHFIDDENSSTLFLGYATAASRLAHQLTEMKIKVNQHHPLHVYLPCGVGGGPGGISFGLKQHFGDHVHCFFAEPTHAPAMLLGLASGLHNEISGADLGLDGHTEADGLAVGRPSGFVGRLMADLIAGVFTVRDALLFQLVYGLHETEQLFLEPSGVAGLSGPWRLAETDWYSHMELTSAATHLIWGTGGGMVPDQERIHILDRGNPTI